MGIPQLILLGILLQPMLIPSQLIDRYELDLKDQRSIAIFEWGMILESYSADNHTWIYLIRLMLPIQLNYSGLLELWSKLHELGLARIQNLSEKLELEPLPAELLRLSGAAGSINVTINPIKSGESYYYLIAASWDAPRGLIMLGICSGNDSRDLVLDLIPRIPSPPSRARFPGFQVLLVGLAWLIGSKILRSTS